MRKAAYRRPGLLAAVAVIALSHASAWAETKSEPVRVERSDALTALLAKIGRGQWVNAPNSHMARVVWDCRTAPCPGNGPLATAIQGNTGPRAIMSTWSGATLDTSNDALIVWGGGHNDYYGNEVYAFSLTRLEWSMLCAPSVVNPGGTVDTNVDNTPVSTHTYDSLAYITSTKQMFVPGEWGATQADSQQSWLFDPSIQSPKATGKWKQAAPYTAGFVDTVAKYDPVSDRVFAVNKGSGLRSYSPADDRWGVVGVQPLSDYHMTGAISPELRMLAVIGGGFLNIMNLKTGIFSLPIASGDLSVQKGNAPGFVWDPVAKLFVAWNGGATLYTLDPHSWQWTAHRAAEGNKVVPTAPAESGTFGRFQYDPSHDVFLVVNDINQDVYFFKPDFGR